MTAALAILSDFWPFLLAAPGVVFGWIRHLQARAATADAKATAARAERQVAQQRESEAKANADAQQAGADATAARVGIENDVAAKPPDEVRNELDRWTRP
ncbi:hypothetical protein [Cupriavidus alkaliphilus]|uniref:hypothetical protein n=1 Tax=Cupriavidus alkaliphilus TaxID=942866 RepID=UPI000DC537A4|nr:hypothetical protein [Cupriavidus alkaliphilus]RAS11262.1 hypothetical protein C7415_102386 [Cupriavidus alkaliphilus]